MLLQVLSEPLLESEFGSDWDARLAKKRTLHDFALNYSMLFLGWLCYAMLAMSSSVPSFKPFELCPPCALDRGAQSSG